MAARRTAALLVLALWVLAAPAAAASDNSVAKAIAALRHNRVYVDPAAQVKLTRAEAKALERQIARDDPGRIFIALLPASARAESGGTVARVGRSIELGVGEPGIVAIIVGTRFEAGSTVLPHRAAAGIATATFAAYHTRGAYTVLTNFVSAAARADPHVAGAQPSSGANVGLILAVVLAAIVVLTLLLLGRVAVRRRRQLRERLAEVRKVAREDQLALADDIRDLDVDVSMPGADSAAKDDYAKALDCYEKAGAALDRSNTLGDLATVPAKLEEGRWLMESARARLAGKPPPERRAPCFFDPRHGPSVRDVDWAPEGGAARSIPVCAADATRLQDGQAPIARTIVLHGRRVPYWEAPRYFGPYAGGYYGGYGGTGFLSGFALGTVLDQHEHAGGDWSAGSWNNSGDFGGGGTFSGGTGIGGGSGGDSGGGGAFGGGGGDGGGGGNGGGGGD